MKEIVVISGKGGTGKTSLTASLAYLASRSGSAVFADCDVDAADLHLVLAPKVRERREFVSGKVARRVPADNGNALEARCAALCRFDAIIRDPDGSWHIDEGSCEGCGVCARHCASGAIVMEDRRCGEWYVSDTPFGPFIHAALYPGAENSGRLVTAVRTEAKRVAARNRADWLLVDGSPGTGCPVIASITGAQYVLIVTEPTVSGLHDLERVASLSRHFGVPFGVCVNKADINGEKAGETEAWCERNGVSFLGRMPYDRAVTRAQIEGRSVVEYSGEHSEITRAIRGIWEKICQ